MSAVGAKLQDCNEQLVYLIEDFKRKLDKIDHEIDKELKEKETLTAQLDVITSNLEKVNESLEIKLELKSKYTDALNETEGAYLKILESSETLLNVVKLRTVKLDDADDEENFS